MPTARGVVTGRDGRFFRIECPNGPDVVRVAYLTPFQVAGAVPGDHVELTYLSGPASGAWVVTKILREE